MISFVCVIFFIVPCQCETARQNRSCLSGQGRFCLPAEQALLLPLPFRKAPVTGTFFRYMNIIILFGTKYICIFIQYFSIRLFLRRGCGIFGRFRVPVMLKKSLIIINTAIISLVAVMITLFLTMNADKYEKDASTQSVSSFSSSEEAKPIYVMQSSNGIIGVYNYGEEYPIKLINVEVKELPEADQNLLNSGIKIYSNEELTRLIEDYNS